MIYSDVLINITSGAGCFPPPLSQGDIKSASIFSLWRIIFVVHSSILFL